MALLLLSSAVTASWELVGSELPFSGTLAHAINYLVTLMIETILLALVFKLLPDAEIAWKDVWIGAFVTAVLFAIGNLLIGLYLGSSTVKTAYGARVRWRFSCSGRTIRRRSSIWGPSSRKSTLAVAARKSSRKRAPRKSRSRSSIVLCPDSGFRAYDKGCPSTPFIRWFDSGSASASASRPSRSGAAGPRSRPGGTR